MDIGKSPSLRLPGATAWQMNYKRYKEHLTERE